MNYIKKNISQYPLGIWIAIFALILIFFAWLMQAYPLLDGEAAVDLGIQNERFTGDAAERAIADVERGVAMAYIFSIGDWAL